MKMEKPTRQFGLQLGLLFSLVGLLSAADPVLVPQVLFYGDWEHIAIAKSAAREDKWKNDLLVPPSVIRNGEMVLPEGPGLGFELNEKLLASRQLGR